MCRKLRNIVPAEALVCGRSKVAEIFGCERRQVVRLVGVGVIPPPLPNPRQTGRQILLWRLGDVQRAHAELSAGVKQQ